MFLRSLNLVNGSYRIRIDVNQVEIPGSPSRGGGTAAAIMSHDDPTDVEQVPESSPVQSRRIVLDNLPHKRGRVDACVGRRMISTLSTTHQTRMLCGSIAVSRRSGRGKAECALGTTSGHRRGLSTKASADATSCGGYRCPCIVGFSGVWDKG